MWISKDNNSVILEKKGRQFSQLSQKTRVNQKNKAAFVDSYYLLAAKDEKHVCVCDHTNHHMTSHSGCEGV